MSDAELARRRAAWKRPRRVTSAASARSISSTSRRPDQGCDFDFLEGTRADRRAGNSLDLMKTIACRKARRPSSPPIMEAGGSQSEAEARTIARAARRFQSRRPRFARRAARRQVSRMGARRAGSSPMPAPTIVFDSDAHRDRRRQSRLRAGRSASSRRGSASRRRRRPASRWLACAIAATWGGSATGPRWPAAAGQVSLHFLNTSGAQRVAPLRRQRPAAVDQSDGDRRAARGRPIRSILDITTSTVAEGKLMVALNKGRAASPEGWIVDKHGKPTTGPEGFLRRRRAADHRRAQGFGTVDPHRPAWRARSRPGAARTRRHGAAQQHAVDLHRARGLRSASGSVLAEARTPRSTA